MIPGAPFRQSITGSFRQKWGAIKRKAKTFGWEITKDGDDEGCFRLGPPAGAQSDYLRALLGLRRRRQAAAPIPSSRLDVRGHCARGDEWVWYDSFMDGVHDIGGMDGFGKIEVEENEPVFHAEWEGRVLAMQRAMSYAGAWCIDHSRFAKERLPPITYLSASYYQRWVLGLEKNIIERGFATAEELKAGHATSTGKMLKMKLTVSVLQDVLTRPSYFRQQQAPPLFKPGDRVRTRNIHPKTHTRLPRYARGKLGVVERCQGCHVYPDSVAVDQGDNPQWLYTVVFTGNELWGPDADPTVQVSIEAFEPYLESA